MIHGIQALRGVAALLVAAFHLYAAAASEGNTDTLFAFFKGGGIGVDIFFVISGFVIYYASARKTVWTKASFLTGRFIRIYPLFWAALISVTLLGFGLYWVAGDASHIVTPAEFLYAATLLPSSEYVISITWTLTIEMVFYLVFALTFIQGKRQPYLFSALSVWACVSIAYALIFSEVTALTYLFHPAVPELMMGALIAHTYKRGPLLPAAGLVTVGAIGVCLNLVFAPMEQYPALRSIVAGLPSACLVYGMVHFGMKRNALANRIGDASYALYLFHIPFYLVIGFILEKATGINVYFSDIAMLSMLLMSLIGAFFIHRLFDERIQTAFRSRWMPQQ